MKRFVKVQGHSNWFLVYEPNTNIDYNLNEVMKEKLFNTVVMNGLHGVVDKGELEYLVKKQGVNELSYERVAKKIGTLLIRPIGSYMPLRGNTITDECFSDNFPIDNFADIVICENDAHAELKWVEYLQNRFPSKKISTINFFYLRTEVEIKEYFEKAQIISFSTTFSNYDRFTKMVKSLNNSHMIIGYSHCPEKWDDALKVYKFIEVVKNLK